MGVNPRDAYFLGYLPAVVGSTLVNYAVVDLVAEQAAGHGKLAEACAFSRKAIAVSETQMRASWKRLYELLGEPAPTALPGAHEYELWAKRVAAAGRAAAGAETAAFEAGLAAGEVHLAMWVARNLIYLRSSAPDHAWLADKTAAMARDLAAAASRLDDALGRLGEAARGEAQAIRAQLGKRPDLATLVGADAMNRYYEWVSALGKRLPALGRALDRPPVTAASVPPTAEERALLEQILAHPEADEPRAKFAALAARRGDPRAELVQLQMALRDLRRGGQTGMGEIDLKKRTAQLIAQHPEWSDRVIELGARAATFHRGFVDEITIDAARFLDSALALYQVAPILHVRLSDAKPVLARLAGSAHLARLRSLDLSGNELDDDDIAALAASPHVANLHFLELTRNRITNRGVEILAASPHLRDAHYIALYQNPCADPVGEPVYIDETTRAWETSPAGDALEAKLGRKIRWLHPQSERWPPEVDTV